MKAQRIVQEKAEVDLTPMLDVVFILLIFFIVTASFLHEKSIRLHSPDTSTKESKGSSIVIVIDQHGSVSMDGRKVAEPSVTGLVAQKLAASPASNIVIRAHELSETQTYISILDSVRRVTLSPVSLLAYSEASI